MHTAQDREAVHVRHREGWDVFESGPVDADHTVLLLPGALCTARFYDDVLAEPSLGAASIRFVATTLPGHGDTRPLDDISVEGCARSAGRLAADLGCDAVVGHSFGANVAIEMAVAGVFSGPLVLVSPSFSRADEATALGIIDRLSRVFGDLPYKAMLKLIGPAMKSHLPPHRSEALIAEWKKNDPSFMRRQNRRYLEYLDRHHTLVPRLCASGVRAWVVFGEHNDVGLADEVRRGLEACPRVTLLEVAGAGHFILGEAPGRVAELILAATAVDAR